LGVALVIRKLMQQRNDARTLERELSAAQKRVEELEGAKVECLAAIEFATNLDAEGAQFLNDWSVGMADAWRDWPSFLDAALKDES